MFINHELIRKYKKAAMTVKVSHLSNHFLEWPGENYEKLVTIVGHKPRPNQELLNTKGSRRLLTSSLDL
jgi:hypothetical protein